MIDKKLMQNHFSINAINYDQYAKVQKKMAEEIINTLRTQEICRLQPKILDVGCGTGYLTSLLFEKFTNSKIVAVDISKGMIEEATKKLVNKDIQFRCEDIENISIDNEYDLIASNAAFQWFNNTYSTFLKLYNSLKPNGTMIISTFGKNTFDELNTSFNQAKDEYKVKDNSTLGQELYEMEHIKKEFENLLKKNEKHFSLDVWEKYEYEYFYSVKDFLNSIKKIGANNSNRSRDFKIPRVIMRMIDLYEKNFKEHNMIKATYHCIYIVVKKLN